MQIFAKKAASNESKRAEQGKVNEIAIKSMCTKQIAVWHYKNLIDTIDVCTRTFVHFHRLFSSCVRSPFRIRIIYCFVWRACACVFLAKWSKMNDFLHLQKDITFEIGLNDDAWINILSTHFLYWKHKNIKSWFEFNGKYIFGRRIISPMAWSGHLISLVKIVLFLICDKCRHLRTKGNLNS